MLGRRRTGTASQRRTGPPGEDPWWDGTDQAFAEHPLLDRRDLGKGWVPMAMVNNDERIDPHGDDEHSQAVRAARAARVLTALDEGHAWRDRRSSSLLVSRVEVFAAPDPGEHRLAWREHGVGCLDGVWRARWAERERTPGWIEARWRAPRDRPPPLGPAGAAPGEGRAVSLPLADAVDWITVEDQTGSDASGRILLYEHLTVWAGRALVTLTLRHDQTDDVDVAAAASVVATCRRLELLAPAG